ncbi:MAG: transporter substrate-binding domain-containing protein [Sphaerochaetaceae bacterium]|nr:transporter substrate-binding domain-containing protein [Sphaerochaetaceae bacterium]
MKKKILLAGFLIFLVISSLISKTVKVGWYESSGLQDGQSDEDLGGYNYEYLCRIAQYAGWDLEFVYKPWKECEEMLIAGEIDLVGDVATTEDRKELYNYCKISNGESRMLMVCSKDNTALTYDDFPSFDGLTVATIPSTFREYLLDELGLKENFKVFFKTYTTHEEIFTAIENKEADTAIFSNVTNFDGSKFKVITIFEPNPFYFIVNKEEIETLEELNDAMESIKTNDFFFDQKLFKKYFMQNIENSKIALTKEEINFVNSNPKVIIGYNENNAPFSSKDKETGGMEGIIADFLNLIETKSGLKFEFKPYPNNEELLQGIKNNEYDINYAALNDIEFSKQYNQDLTQSYLTIQNGILFKVDNISKVKTLAIVKNSIIPELTKNSKYQIKEYDSSPDCLVALNTGEVDGALISTYFYEMMFSYQKYKKMSFKLLPSYQTEICFGISNKANKNLYTIFEKSIGNIGTTERNSILLNNKSLIVNFTFWDKILNNLVMILIFVFVTFLMITIILILHHSNGQKKKNEITLTKQNQELKKVSTRLNYINHQLEKTVREANAANEAKTNFLLSVSHDIRTPMNAIISMTNLALLDLNNKKQIKESLDITKMASLQLLELINNLLDMSSIERGTLEINETQHFNIKIEAENLKRQMKQIAENKGINLLVKTKITHEHVVSDLQQLRRVILNLINNSLKYTLKEGTVTFSIVETDFSKFPKEIFKEDPSYRIYSICVSDNGIGMTKKQVTHVFEKFYQANQSNNINKTQGIGLGLSISKEIITMMNGTISVSSVYKVGSTFTVNVPLKIYEGTEDGENLIIEPNIGNKENIDYNFNGKKALIVDDNEINLLVLKRILQQTKMEVVLARNGKEAVEQFKNSKKGEFSIILIDISMPIMNGYEATKEIRESTHPNGKTIPIVAVTANTFDADRQILLKSGMQGHILKPIKVKDLMNLLQNLLK